MSLEFMYKADSAIITEYIYNKLWLAEKPREVRVQLIKGVKELITNEVELAKHVNNTIADARGKVEKYGKEMKERNITIYSQTEICKAYLDLIKSGIDMKFPYERVFTQLYIANRRECKNNCRHYTYSIEMVCDHCRFKNYVKKIKEVLQGINANPLSEEDIKGKLKEGDTQLQLQVLLTKIGVNEGIMELVRVNEGSHLRVYRFKGCTGKILPTDMDGILTKYTENKRIYQLFYNK